MSDMRTWLDAMGGTNVEEDQVAKQAQKDNKFRKKIGLERASLIDDLADRIEDMGLEQEAIKLIDQIGGKWYSNESVENNGDELMEKVIDDAGIKKVLMQLAKMDSGMDSEESELSPESIDQYLDNWAEAMDKAYVNMQWIPNNTKMNVDGDIYSWDGSGWNKPIGNDEWVPVSAEEGDPTSLELTDRYLIRAGKEYGVSDLTNEILHYLKDRKDDPNWNMIARRVKKEISKYAGRTDATDVRDMIDNGETLEAVFYHELTKVLSEMSSTWYELGYKPSNLNENRVHLEYCVPGRDILLSEFLTDLAAYDRIRAYNKRE